MEEIMRCSAEIRLAIRSTLSSGSLRRCDRIVWWCVGFVRRDACVFSNVPPASRCGPPARARKARGVSASILNYTQIRQQKIVVGDQRPFRRCAQRCEFSIVPIPDEDKGARIDGACKLPFRLEEISDFLPVEAPNSA